MPSSRSIKSFFSDGTAQPFPELMQLAYSELRRMAGHFFRTERAEHTLQPTALVHEVFIRLAEYGPSRYENRAHFFAVAARQMRQILVDHGRRVQALKRGGRWQRVTLDDVHLASPDFSDFVALDEVLKRFETVDPRLSSIVDLRVFGGLSSKEIAAVLHMGESTVRKGWDDARAWLKSELEKTVS